MKRIRVSCIILWAFAAFSASSLFGAIPQMINYQGRLTSAVGSPVNDTVDLVFDICVDSLCSRPLWEETQTGVIVKDGLFNVLLGSITPVSPSVFSGSVVWLSVSKDGVAASRGLRMVSSPYAFKSLHADTADYARNGSATDCADCDAVFVNVVGPDSVYVTYGAALLGKSLGTGASDNIGINGYASNSYVGYAYGGLFTTSNAGTGQHIGVKGDGEGASNTDVFGVQGWGNNTSTGDSYGGRFITTTNGTGVHYALSSKGWANSSSGTYGIDASASNSSTGPAYGGAFTASTGGTGIHYGITVNSYSTYEANYGVWSVADNTYSTSTYGGFFRATSSGTGNHYAIVGNALSASANDAYGSYGWAQSTSTGDAYGGFFSTNSSGTGVHYALRAESYGASSSPVHGVNGYAQNSSTGSVYAGIFNATSSGTGSHYGIYSQSAGTSSNSDYGVLGTASNSSTGTVYGISGTATNSSAGSTYGGAFYTSTSGTGRHTGLAAWGNQNNADEAVGVYGLAQNVSSGAATAGYFVGAAGGTGQKFGIYAEVPGGPSDWAGWFEGPVRIQGGLWVQGDFYTVGSKSAATKMDNGDYRAVYSQESPENWFEDFGEGQLANGKTHIDLDPMFLQTVTVDVQHPIKVFIQLNDENCNGTAVKRGTTGFDVVEVQNGTSNASFSYRIVAKRKGYEDVRLSKIPDPATKDLKARSAKIQEEMEKDRAKLEMESKVVDSEQARPKKVPAEMEQQ